MLRECVVLRLGQTPYQAAWRLQEKLADEIGQGLRPPTLLLLEHPHTYTFGRRGRPEHLLWSPAELEQRGIELVWSDRGGDITYHGPGQLVGYPLLPLGALQQPAAADAGAGQIPKADYVAYLRKLEQMLILALERLGVGACQQPGLTGVWIAPNGGAPSGQPAPVPAKIASIGVKVDARGVSRHGFALNVNPQMEYWQGIIACGLKDHPLTSLAALVSPPPGMNDVNQAVIEAFGQVFGYQIRSENG
jgi:lipoate-protein ligase B